jgi:GNAT superfamily N-acetyltransferase
MTRLGRGRAIEMPATVTYLAMHARPSIPPPPPPLMKIAILKAEKPAVHFYRYLYNTIGGPYFWVERRLWSDEKLANMLASAKVALYVLYVAGSPGGMAELDFREEGAGQLAYFGLMPDYIGRRIGPWFLHQTVELAWAEPISRLLVNTCTLDHRKALPAYQRAGFTAYARIERAVLVPPDFTQS